MLKIPVRVIHNQQSINKYLTMGVKNKKYWKLCIIIFFLEHCHGNQETNNNINGRIKLHGFLENEELHSIIVVDST